MFLVTGNTNVDLFISGFNELPSVDGDEFTNTSLIFTSRPLVASIGGNGGNLAYMLGNFRVPTALCSAIGQDVMGELVIGWLKSKGVTLDALARYADDGTPTNTIITDGHHNRLSFYYGQPTFRYTLDQIPQALIDRAEGVAISAYSLFTQLRGEGYRHLLETVHSRGGVTAVDIGPALLEPARIDELRPLLPLIDYLIANEYELSVCTGISDRDEGVEALLRAGANMVLVKRGKNGVIARSRETVLEVPAFPVTTAATTVGAGDSFNAGFLYALRQGKALRDALVFGSATAALVVASGKGVLGAPTLAEVERLANTVSP